MTVVMVVAVSLVAAAFNVAWSSAASAQIQAAKATSHAKTISFDLAGATLEQFTPITSRTWWAVVEGDNSGSDVVRTEDSGQHWEDVWTSPTGAIASSDFLNGKVGWIVDWVEQGSANPPPSEPLYRTVDGGQSWQRLVNVPNGCPVGLRRPPPWLVHSDRGGGGVCGLRSLWHYQRRLHLELGVKHRTERLRFHSRSRTVWLRQGDSLHITVCRLALFALQRWRVLPVGHSRCRLTVGAKRSATTQWYNNAGLWVTAR